jgi:glycosyltransferase involved in cell wall biosynthesis
MSVRPKPFQELFFMTQAKITVLDLRDSPWTDGPGRTILECAEDICKEKFRVIIGAFDSGRIDGTPYEHEARKKGLDVFRIRERSAFDIRVFQQIANFVNEHRIGLLHTHDFRSHLVGIVAAKLFRRPIVATVHGWISNNGKSKIKTALDKWIVCRSDHVIAVSKATLKLLGKGIDDDHVTVIPNALRPEQFIPMRPFGKFRESLSIEPDEIVIANIGRLNPEKGQELFIEAAKEIAARNRKVRFLLIGIGRDQEKLEALVKNYGLERYVIFAGFRNDMASIYNDIDLVVQSSWTEGMPNVVLESLLMEVPVIATDVGGTSEVMSNGNTGVLIAPGDLKGLIKLISEFIENRIAMVEMAKRGREDVMRRFNHAERVKKLESVYESVFASWKGKQVR